MKTLVIYCHPSNDSFTYQVKESFVSGLIARGEIVTVEDLYARNFNPVMSEEEYLREGYYDNQKDIPNDILYQQELINNHDAVVFIYPVFWTDVPAMLKGYFDRVFTYGFAYGDNMTMKQLDKCLCLVTMGGDLKEPLRQKQLAAMKEVMINDRIGNRFKEVDFVVYDRMSRDYDDRDKKFDKYLNNAYHKGFNFYK